MFEATGLFDLSQFSHPEIFAECKYAWEVLPRIAAFVEKTVRPALRNRCEGRAWIGEKVFIGEGTVVEDGAMIKGPAIIGKNCQIRHNAYIREHVLVGDNCVIGNSSEVKNAILFNGSQVPHFNYVGDSVLGYKAHLGAGVKISNYKLFGDNISIQLEDGNPHDTGLRKFGALLGDHCEIGCNAVLSPGSIIGRESVIYPNISWRGILPDKMIVKGESRDQIVPRRERGL